MEYNIMENNESIANLPDSAFDGGGAVRHLLTIETEGTYTIENLILFRPVIFTYQAPNKLYNRFPLEFVSGSAFLTPGEYRQLGLLAYAISSISTSPVASQSNLIIIPTATELVVSVNTSKYGISALANSGIRVHVFQ